MRAVASASGPEMRSGASPRSQYPSSTPRRAAARKAGSGQSHREVCGPAVADLSMQSIQTVAPVSQEADGVGELAEDRARHALGDGRGFVQRRPCQGRRLRSADLRIGGVTRSCVE